MDFLRPYTSQLLSVLRVMSGLLLLQHGTTKYLNFPVSQFSNASPMTMGGAAGVLELIGGALLISGLFTRPVAFVLSGMTAVAYFYAHTALGASFRCSMAANSRRSIASYSSTSLQQAVVHGVSID